MTKFEVGKEYIMRSTLDWDFIYRYTVIARTEKTITVLSDKGEKQTLRINKAFSEYRNTETVFPLGRYSMAPTLRA